MATNLGKCMECFEEKCIDIFIPGEYTGVVKNIPVRRARARIKADVRRQLAKAKRAVVIFDGKGICLEHLVDKVEHLEI